MYNSGKMKRLLAYLFIVLGFGLVFNNFAFAKCTKGDCTNGYGTYSWRLDTEPTIDMLESSKMVNSTDKELTRIKDMEESTWDNLVKNYLLSMQ